MAVATLRLVKTSYCFKKIKLFEPDPPTINPSRITPFVTVDAAYMLMERNKQ
jgi:hypothetical protein